LLGERSQKGAPTTRVTASNIVKNQHREWQIEDHVVYASHGREGVFPLL
jgi:hypothetical protein